MVERLRTYARPGVKPIFLLGNHEEVLLRILDGDSSHIGQWLRFGGAQCLRSYGVDPLAIRRMSDSAALSAIRAAVPIAHAEFIHSFCRYASALATM